jgi:hypothetical protein
MKTTRTRFAPSPTGPLHMGGVRTALYAYLFAKRNNSTYFSAFDVIGRTIVSKKVASNLSADELTTLKSKGAFVIKVESATCFNTFKL